MAERQLTRRALSSLVRRLVDIVYPQRLLLAPGESFLGKIWSAIGSDEIALSSAGVRPSDYKALAFAVGSCIAGLAGSLLAHQYSYIDPTLFTSDLSMLALTTIVLGAMNSAFGAILGALVLVGGPEFMRMTQDARLLSYGVLLLLLIRFRPHGLWARRI
jgi:branched-chain amino acid transport system permease protein